MINIVKKAGDAFKLGQYELAKYYYQLAAEQLGEKFFKNNIIICDLYLCEIEAEDAISKRKDRSLNDYLLNHRVDPNYYIILDTPHNIILNEFDREDILVTIKCKGNSFSENKPQGIALFKFYDSEGVEIHKFNRSTALSWSDHLKKWYFYLRPNDKGIVEYKFIKPIEAHKIIIEFSGWDCKTLEIQNRIKVITKSEGEDDTSLSLLSLLNKKRGDEYFKFLVNKDLNSASKLALNKSYSIVFDNLANDAEDIQIRIPCIDKDKVNNKPSAIIKFKFYDADGLEIVDLKSTNLSWSNYLKTWYLYINIEERDSSELFEYEFLKPQGIRSIRMEFDKWQSDALYISNSIEIIKRPSILSFINTDYNNLLRELYSSDSGKSRYKPKTTNICYVLNHSLPYQSEGYATRAQGLSKAIYEQDVSIVCVTRPGYPTSFLADYKGKKVASVDTIDKIHYERITQPTGWRGSHNYIMKAALELEKKFLEIKPSCVMAASDFKNALPALLAAKRVGIPFIYEVRGFWEVTHVSRDPSAIYTSNYHLTQFMETEVAKYSDFVFTLTDAMKRELVSRGVDASKIELLPNSCDPKVFDPAKNKRNKKLAKKLGIPINVPVIGYIGTFNSYEGLDDLMEACGRLYQSGREFRVLLVGSEPNAKDGVGPCSSEIIGIAKKYGFSDWLIMPGRIPHDEVAAYYSLITITPFTRKPLPVTELVSPLKPLEAMAMGKTLVVSSVEALAEMVKDNETGLVYEKGSIDDLYAKLEILFDTPALCDSFGIQARNWVEKNRTWEICSKKVIEKVNLLENSYKDREISSAHNLPSKKAQDYTVAFIADEFTYNSFKDEFNAVIIEPDNWKALFEIHKPDIFFCESAWSGVDSERRPWQGKIYTSINWDKENRTILFNILEHCRLNGIPTVFWNKEDPTHFTDRVHDFISTAKEFDFVFTTAEECCELYRKEYGVKNVFALPFATNPKLFNPIEQGTRDNKVVFAGSWYENHEQRSKDMEFILDNILKNQLSLEIVDRYYGNDDPLHTWPNKYLQYTTPGRPHTEMPNVYRSSVFGLNFNTVTDSKTMFARRVFELMSSNTLVISNYSQGVDEMFGDLVVFADRDPARLNSLTESDISALREKALTLVLKEHTYTNRWHQILTNIGMPWVDTKDNLTLVFKVSDESDVQLAINTFQSQFSNDSGNKLLLLVSLDVDPLQVSEFYQKFNRTGICVTSEKHMTEYALNEMYRPIETKYFVYADKDNVPSYDWVVNALPHFRYIEDVCLANAIDSKYRYQRIDKSNCNLVGRAEDFYKIFSSHEKDLNAYLV